MDYTVILQSVLYLLPTGLVIFIGLILLAIHIKDNLAKQLIVASLIITLVESLLGNVVIWVYIYNNQLDAGYTIIRIFFIIVSVIAWILLFAGIARLAKLAGQSKVAETIPILEERAEEHPVEEHPETTQDLV